MRPHSVRVRAKILRQGDRLSIFPRSKSLPHIVGASQLVLCDFGRNRPQPAGGETPSLLYDESATDVLQQPRKGIRRRSCVQ